MPTQVLFENAEHKNLLLEDFTSGRMVQANQHLILHNGKAMLLDPGGHKVYSAALEELSTYVSPSALQYIFFSHQDPDIVAAANGWLMVTDAQAFLPQLWIRFITHFGVDDFLVDRIEALPDQGRVIELAGSKLAILPAHFLHSAGNFQVYDPVSKILYSGDLGASLGQTYVTVENFDDHIQYMEGFHRRYMSSNKALKLWATMVKPLEIEIIAPQHGAMIVGKENVQRFIAWSEGLACGLDLLERVYRLPRV
ncbi:MAG: FprA family A-type flavoprotein [Anaerolineae bacterium]|nr:FprA family A-type flavoprotein [Anaerolineae bacterium]